MLEPLRKGILLYTSEIHMKELRPLKKFEEDQVSILIYLFFFFFANKFHKFFLQYWVIQSYSPVHGLEKPLQLI